MTKLEFLKDFTDQSKVKICILISSFWFFGFANATPANVIDRLLKINKPVQCDLAQDACTEIAEKSCKSKGSVLNELVESKVITSKVNQIFNTHLDFMNKSERECLSKFFNLSCSNGSSQKCKPLIAEELRKYYLDQTMGSTLSSQGPITKEKANSFFKGCFTGKDSEKKYQDFSSQMANFAPLVYKTVKDDLVKPSFISNAAKVFNDVKSSLVTRIIVSVDDALQTRAMVKQINKTKLVIKGLDGTSSSFLDSMKSMCTQFNPVENSIEVCMGKLMSNQGEFYMAQMFAREMSRLIAPDHASEMGFDDVKSYPLSKQMDQCADLKKSESKELLSRYDSEKFADHFATDVLHRMITRRNPSLTFDERKEAYLNAVREGCDRGESGQSLILLNPNIRSDLKCSELKPADNKYCKFSLSE